MLLLPLSNFWNKLSTDSGFYRRVGREMALLLGGVRTSLQHFWGRRAEWRAIWFHEMRLIILACKKVFCFLVSLEQRIDCVVSSSCHRIKWNSSLLQHLKRTHEAEHRWKTSAAAERKLLQNELFPMRKQNERILCLVQNECSRFSGLCYITLHIHKYMRSAEGVFWLLFGRIRMFAIIVCLAFEWNNIQVFKSKATLVNKCVLLDKPCCSRFKCPSTLKKSQPDPSKNERNLRNWPSALNIFLFVSS